MKVFDLVSGSGGVFPFVAVTDVLETVCSLDGDGVGGGVMVWLWVGGTVFDMVKSDDGVAVGGGVMVSDSVPV